MKKALKTCINNLFLQYPILEDIGLKSGKVKVLLALYLAAEVLEDEVLFDFCDREFFDLLIEMKNNDLSYSNGLVGIAETIDLLTELELIEVKDRIGLMESVEIEVIRTEDTLDNVEFLHKNLFVIKNIKEDHNRIYDLKELLAIDQALVVLERINEVINGFFHEDIEQFTSLIISKQSINEYNWFLKSLILYVKYLSVLERKKIHNKQVEIINNKISKLIEKQIEYVLHLFKDRDDIKLEREGLIIAFLKLYFLINHSLSDFKYNSSYDEFVLKMLRSHFNTNSLNETYFFDSLKYFLMLFDVINDSKLINLVENNIKESIGQIPFDNVYANTFSAALLSSFINPKFRRALIFF